MAFQTKDFVSIVAGALNHLRGSTDKITDFHVGSVARTLIEGPSVEIEELYQQMFIGLREAIPVATFLSFGFEKLPASRAQGLVTVTRPASALNPLTIPAGTVFKTADGISYASTDAVIWPADDLSVDIPVRASVSGLSGNTSAGQIVSSDFLSSQSFTSQVSNLPISNGRDAETDAEREARFAEFVQSLSRGTVVAVKYAVGQARVVEPGGIVSEYVSRVGFAEYGGRVWLYIYSSNGVPSDALIANGQQIIDGYVDPVTGIVVPGYRAAGVRVDVLPMAERAVTSTVQVGMFDGYTLDSTVRNAMTDIFHEVVRSIESGSVLYINDLVERLLTVPGVRRVVVDNDENILCAVNEVLIPGAFEADPLND